MAIANRCNAAVQRGCNVLRKVCEMLARGRWCGNIGDTGTVAATAIEIISRVPKGEGVL